ncbi:MAG: peptidoglycan-binding domain-containing protein [Dialister invisus]
MRKLYILELAAALWLCMAGSVSAEILHMGMRGAAVESLQNDLVEAGYLARTVDGDY